MTWLRLTYILAGVGCIVGGALLPAVAPYLIPAGTGLLGLGLPTPGLREPGPPGK